MFKKIVSIKTSYKRVIEIKELGKRIVLVGGCFDILHLGHVVFLQKAKALGDFLVVLVESDKGVQRKKGKERPINDQKSRARVLEALEVVDMVVLLKDMTNDSDYDELVLKLKPDFIATTKADVELFHKERVANLADAKLRVVTKRLPNHSSSFIHKALDN